MRNIISLIAAILLTFLAIALLMASIQYSSDLIGVKVQNVTILPTSVEINGSSNSTGGNAPESGGDSQPVPRGGGNSGLNAINMSSLSFMSGGNPKVPDLKDPDNLLLFIIIIILLLITLALIGYIIWRRRHSKKAPPESKVVVAPKLPEYVEGDYRIKFTQICKPFPAVWGEGEPLDIVVEGKEGAISPVVLEIDGEVRRDVHLDEGGVQLRLNLDKGDHYITVSPQDAKGLKGPSRAEIRIVDYREEVVRMFNEMYLNYRSRYEDVNEKMTPREMERTVSSGWPEAKKKTLGVAVAVFELANYSMHAISRGEFERMYLSRLDTT